MTNRKIPFRAVVLTALLLLFSLFCHGTYAATPIRLFTVERSTNANYVCYDANLTESGSIDPDHPISAYWIMAAQDGHREELTGLERRFAYGFSFQTDASGGLRLAIQALKDQPIMVSLASGEAKAETEIQGHRVSLKKVFVQNGGGLFPRIDFIKLTGVDSASGADTGVTLHP
jgi:hypothetical protein